MCPKTLAASVRPTILFSALIGWVWAVCDICLVMSIVSVSPHLNATFVAPIFLTLMAVGAENP